MSLISKHDIWQSQTGKLGELTQMFGLLRRFVPHRR
jgi:hypothetical protein